MGQTHVPLIALHDAQSAEQITAIRHLFKEYQDSLSVDLCFQGFERELAELPGDYVTPTGALLLATVEGAPAGCCALRPLLNTDHTNACEMKRLFVRKAFRGFGIGRLLVERIMDLAEQAAYDAVLLDTLDDMEAARGLYMEVGFEEIEPYYHNPLAGAHYLKAPLRPRLR
jgi:putative acetyltransferase